MYAEEVCLMLCELHDRKNSGILPVGQEIRLTLRIDDLTKAFRVG